jgi:hypothetical protein
MLGVICIIGLGVVIEPSGAVMGFDPMTALCACWSIELSPPHAAIAAALRSSRKTRAFIGTSFEWVVSLHELRLAVVPFWPVAIAREPESQPMLER